MHDRSADSAGSASSRHYPGTQREARQRWRLIFARGEATRFVAHGDEVKLWERAFRSAKLPIAMTQGSTPRPRFAFAAPLPLGMTAEHELADLFLVERLSLPDLRDRLDPHVPDGHRIADLHDVWVGEASLASRVVRADYQVEVSGVDRSAIESAIARFMASESVLRERRRETRTMASDLRPFVLDLVIHGWVDRPAGGGSGTLWARLRHDPELGTGRPDEVVAALGERVGLPTAQAGALEIGHAKRLRLWLRDEVAAETSPR